MSAEVITKWWPQITALFILVFWISRTISELKGRNETQDERLRQIDKKVEQLFVLWNKHIDRLLDEARHDCFVFPLFAWYRLSNRLFWARLTLHFS